MLDNNNLFFFLIKKYFFIMKNLDKTFSVFLLEHNSTRKEFCKDNSLNITTLKNWLTRKIVPKVDDAFLLQKKTNGAISLEDFCKDTISSDQNNITNNKINVKNSASEVVSSDLKADDVG